MIVANDTRSTLDKYMPVLIGLLAAFLAGKALKRSFWSIVWMVWFLHATGVHLF